MCILLQVLGVERTAARREVKAAYKQLALSLHPDKQRDVTQEHAATLVQHFQAVAEAYDVLANECQRAAYDRVRDYMVSLRSVHCSCLYRHSRAGMGMLCRNCTGIAH